MRAAVLVLAAVVGGCGPVGALKGYDGPERPAADVGLLELHIQEGPFAVTDPTVAVIDGVKQKGVHYAALVLPGMHWFGISSVFRIGPKREQFCAFELNVDPGCTYQPFLPGYVRSPIDEKEGRDLHVGTLMQVQIDCPGLQYATRTPVECATRTLCRDDSACSGGTSCVKAEGYAFGACR